jgi:hypothetical protein
MNLIMMQTEIYLTQMRNGSAVTPDLDNLTYPYYSGTNRLKYVDDAVNSARINK